VTRWRPGRGKMARWDTGWLRVSRLLLFLAAYLLIMLVRSAAFPDGREPVLWWERAVQLHSWCWLGALPAALTAMMSLAVPAAPRPPGAGRPVPQLVCFRVVSRGRNVEALAETVTAIRTTMALRNLFPYRIEVVTDEQVALPLGPDVRAYVVPTDYQTPNGSLYKARALHYLSEYSDLPDSAWVFHCDEESQVTPGLLGGIRDSVVEEEARAAEGKTPRIGQGCIVYWRSLREHPILTLADSLRTGDDATRFRTQFRTGALFCGMHGSFILVRSDVERTISFDVGLEGSITEGAWWAFAQASSGRAFRWVDGYLVEQSPEHWKDFAKQRRRWYSGLWKVCLYAPALHRPGRPGDVPADLGGVGRRRRLHGAQPVHRLRNTGDPEGGRRPGLRLVRLLLCHRAVAVAAVDAGRAQAQPTDAVRSVLRAGPVAAGVRDARGDGCALRDRQAGAWLPRDQQVPAAGRRRVPGDPGAADIRRPGAHATGLGPQRLSPGRPADPPALALAD